MRIAIAGIHHEASTFSRYIAPRSFFSLIRGDEILREYRLEERLGDVVHGVDWVPILRAAAGASGPVDPAVYDAFEAEIVAGLAAAGKLDGVYLDLHGAMNVLGRRGAEERLVRAVREVVGPRPVISASMDTHGNLSRDLAVDLDLAACHRHAPHIDNMVTRDRAITKLIAVIRSGERPLKAWVRVPVLLPGERTSTVVEPARSIFGDLVPAIDRYGVLDANLWVGFAWADEPRCAAAVLVTGYDARAISECATELAQAYWNARENFGIVSERYGSWDEALDYLLTGPPRPTYVSDAGDNATAGASSDSTYALAATLARSDVLASGRKILFTGLFDPGAVEAAIIAGAGAIMERAIGAWLDDRDAAPVRQRWQVQELVPGILDGQIVGALLRTGNVSVLVQSHRQRFVSGRDAAHPFFPMMGLCYTDTSPYDAVVVKNGYLFPGQAEEAASSFIALTPGGTDLDFERLAFHQLARPMFPFDRSFDAPLAPELLPGGPASSTEGSRPCA